MSALRDEVTFLRLYKGKSEYHWTLVSSAEAAVYEQLQLKECQPEHVVTPLQTMCAAARRPSRARRPTAGAA